MDICGNVLVSKDVLNFAIKCLYCETNIEEWEAFVNHIQSLHNNFEEPCIDPLVELDYKEDILIEGIKDEVPTTFEATVLENVDTELKMEVASDDEFVKDEELYEEDSGTDYDPNQNNDEASDSDSDFDSNSIKEELQKERRKKFNPTFWRRNASTFAFIELYKNAPCLWNPNDEHYSDNATRESSQKKIIEEMKAKFDYTLTNQALKVCLRKLYLQYESTLEAKDTKTKPQLKKMPNVMFEYFEKCTFLAVAKNEFMDAVEKAPNTSTNLSFAKLNPTTETFIETYALFPPLYDPKHEDRNDPAVRRQCYAEMSNIMKTKENIDFTEDEILKGIHCIRHWYYKTKNRLATNKNKDLARSAKVYLQKCSFLPAKPPSKKLKCTECDKLFQNETTRQSHLFKEHNIGDWPFKCDQCQRSFEYKAQLTMHEQRQHVGKVHKCDYCERLFAVQVDLQRHIDTHTGHKPFVCELCGKAFRSKTQLGYHSDAIHTKTRAYKCTMCPKDFLKARDLKDHIKAHLNIRDKICETCGKGFTNCHSLIRHRQIHSEVKKFACKLCEAKFHQFVGLNSHMKRTHGIVKNPQ